MILYINKTIEYLGGKRVKVPSQVVRMNELLGVTSFSINHINLLCMPNDYDGLNGHKLTVNNQTNSETTESTLEMILSKIYDSYDYEQAQDILWRLYVAAILSEDMDGQSGQHRSRTAYFLRMLLEVLMDLEIEYYEMRA